MEVPLRGCTVNSRKREHHTDLQLKCGGGGEHTLRCEFADRRIGGGSAGVSSREGYAERWVEAIKAAQLAADCGEGLQQATSLDSSELEQRLAPARGRKAAKARARQAKKLSAVLDHAKLFANVYAALAHGRLGSPEEAVRHWKAAAALAPQSAILRCHAGDRQAQTAARKRALADS